MILKARRSPVPHEHVHKNGKSDNFLENGVAHLVASNASLSKLIKAIIVLVIITLIVNLLNLYGLKQFEARSTDEKRDVPIFLPLQSHSTLQSNKPIVWFSGRRIEAGYLKHVIDLFERLGFQKTLNGTNGQWDVLWSHEYPFMNNFLPELKPHQRVNHFPGSGFITNKVNLATSDLKHIPKAFNLPLEKREFLQFAKNNPEKLWVQKSNNHRGIKVESIDDLNLDASGTFVQEYIRNPFLIDKKKFDIGIYSIMTSINPLRVYIYEADALLRFCSKPYYPFNKTDLDSYVVGDDYTPTWEMPSLKKYFNDLNLNMKETLNAYVRSLGKDPKLIWKQIEESIKTVYISKEEQMLRISSNFPSTRNFFEMVRFDFALDEDLNVYLMEANMSPNLSSSHFSFNRLLYEQVIFNLLSLVGVARTLQFPSWNERPSQLWDMMVSEKDLSVNEEICTLNECHLGCKSSECNTCYPCLNQPFKMMLKDAVLEHLSKWNCKRLIPSTDTQETLQPKGAVNKLQTDWFKGKCLQDKTWCN